MSAARNSSIVSKVLTHSRFSFKVRIAIARLRSASEARPLLQNGVRYLFADGWAGLLLL